MLIAFIVTAIVTMVAIAVLYALLNIFYKKADRSDYDFVTGPPKGFVIFGHTFFGVSFAAFVADIILYFFWKNAVGLWCIYGIALLFSLLALLLIFSLYFTFEAIKGDEVHARRFFKTKIIKVSDIRNINNLGMMTVFSDRYGNALFYADSPTKGLYDLIRMINERRAALGDDANETKLYSEEGEALLIKMGQEYRASYGERRKKFVLKFVLIAVGALIAIVLSLYFLNPRALDEVVMIGVMGAFALALCGFSFLTTMKNELKRDDLTLGNAYKFKNKRIKGASKDKFKKTRLVCLPLLIAGVIVGGIAAAVWATSDKEYSYDEYKAVTGTVEYCREQSSMKNSYIAIGLKDNPTEYRLDSIFVYEFDYSFFDEVKAGDTITIYIDTGEDHTFSMKGVSKKRFNSFYYLEANGKEYFSYDDFVKSHERNDRIGDAIIVVGLAACAAAAIVLIATYFVCKKREKVEDIDIYYKEKETAQ